MTLTRHLRRAAHRAARTFRRRSRRYDSRLFADHAQERGLDALAPHFDAAHLNADFLRHLEHELARRGRR